jgi:hypothetical protein
VIEISVFCSKISRQEEANQYISSKGHLVHQDSGKYVYLRIEIHQLPGFMLQYEHQARNLVKWFQGGAICNPVKNINVSQTLLTLKPQTLVLA